MSAFPLLISHGQVSPEEPIAVRRGVPARSRRVSHRVVDGFNGAVRDGSGGAVRLWAFAPAADAREPEDRGWAWAAWLSAYPVSSVSSGV
jgi:hypothetical protein